MVRTRFDRTQVDRIRDPLCMAHAAARVSAMFVLKSELPAVKFADIGRRRRGLFGEDVFAKLKPALEAQIQRLKQMLANLTSRWRNRYAGEPARGATGPGARGRDQAVARCGGGDPGTGGTAGRVRQSGASHGWRRRRAGGRSDLRDAAHAEQEFDVGLGLLELV